MALTPSAQLRHDYTDRTSVMAPGRKAFTPTTDSVDFPDGPVKSIWVGVTGNLVGRGVDDDSDQTFPNVPVGWFDYQFKHLTAATTAGSLKGVY